MSQQQPSPPPPSSKSSSSPLRFLTRPSHSPPPPSSLQQSPNNHSNPPLPDSGVVVVGLLSSRPAASAAPNLLNRLLDRRAFSPGGLDTDLVSQRNPEWFEHRRISYCRDEERGIVFVLFQSDPSRMRRIEMGIGTGKGSDLVLEDWEADDLRGELFMFTVCHVIIFLQEGSRFDTHILRKFRILQRAKNALAPFVRSQSTPPLSSKSSAMPSQTSMSSSSSRSPSRTSGGRHGGRHSSAVSLMSGPGSHNSALPGQCIPVVLFVFYDELMDGTSSGFSSDDSSDSLLNQSLSFTGMNKPSATSRASSSVVVLARPASKTESSFRKKLQSSLDSQIRFLIKKCRILVGSEYSLRGAGTAGFSPLFSIDASRAVVLLDKMSLLSGKSLDLVTRCLEDVLNSKLSWDAFVPESHNVDDIQAIKDFIYRQSDSLRGRGALTANTTSGSAGAGVGMVALAAAAAAASAAAGKPLVAPKLPSMDIWESFCNHALDMLLSVAHQFVGEIGPSKKLPPALRKVSDMKVEEIMEIQHTSAEAAVSCLGCVTGLNMRFSTEWCKSALPAARGIYLEGLPTYYPTALHKSHLEKALRAFSSMVRGSALQTFTRNLEDECNSIWLSGRQLCDAISLTGKPCMHQRHDGCLGSQKEMESKKHSSGHAFLHACACGRSRCLRDDPFDFYNANVSFNYFPSCEKFLPALKLPKGIHGSGPIHASWSLFRLGGGKYYEPSKGLLQSGFCGIDKYLSEWKLVPNNSQYGELTFSDSPAYPGQETTGSSATEKVDNFSTGLLPKEVEDVDPKCKKDFDSTSLQEPCVQFGKGFPAFVMKKPFSEVVAGNTSSNPVLTSHHAKKQPVISGPEKCANFMPTCSQSVKQGNLFNGHSRSEATRDTSVPESSSDPRSSIYTSGNPFLQIGSNMVPVNVTDEVNVQRKISEEEKFNVYVGFEHECPHGHRFFLSEEHLDKLGSFYSLPGCPSSLKDSDGKRSKSRLDAMGNDNNIPQFSRIVDKEKEFNSKHASSGSDMHYDLQQARKLHHSTPSDGHKQSFPSLGFTHCGNAVSLLNRNLPIFMNCPHCQNPVEKNQESVKFASNVSQLQRIFLVTPPFPVVLALSPAVQFEVSHLPPVHDREKQSQFSLGCRVILPPESFLSLRLPFVYGIQLDDRRLHPLVCNEEKPELSAWLVKGTTLKIVSKDFNTNESSEVL